jgi:hypothetical protein
MAISIILALLSFIISLAVSTLIIWVITKILGEHEGLLTAVLAAIGGSIIYSVSYAIFSHGLISTLVGGVTWLIALKMLYNIGWLKAFLIAIVIWVIANLLGFLPTLTGPL